MRARPWAFHDIPDRILAERYGISARSVSRARHRVAAAVPDIRELLVPTPADQAEPDIRAALAVTAARLRVLERQHDTFRHRAGVKRARNLERLCAWLLAHFASAETEELPEPFRSLAADVRREELEPAGAAYWERMAVERFGAPVGPAQSKAEAERSAACAVWIEEQRRRDPYPEAVLARAHGGGNGET